MKRITSVVLCLSLVVSLFVTGTSATQTESIPHSLCSTQEWDVLRLTNEQRLAQGLLPLSTFDKMQQAAEVRVGELTSRFSHTRPDGTEPFTALTEHGLNYTRAAENIAAGQTSASSVTTAWLGSEGHKANILDDRFVHMGVGYTNKPCTIVTETGVGQISHGWVQLFMTTLCSITSITPSKQSLSIDDGSNLESLDLYLTLKCSVHGDCYMPLLDEMCTGYDPAASGAQTATVHYGTLTSTIRINHTNSGGNSSSGSSSSTPSTPMPTPDLTSADSWAVDWINKAHSLSLLSAMNMTGFKNDVTRLQFADLSVRLAEQLTGKAITPAHKTSFTDTTDDSILKAKAAGIAAGYEVSGKYEFRPGNPITREEICVMLAHVADYVSANGGPALADTDTAVKGVFLDTDTVADWAVKQVALMTNNSIMGGKAGSNGNSIDPKSNTALQEAITLAVKLNTSLSK